MSAVVIPINTPVDNTTGSPQVPTGAPNVPRRSIVSKPLRPAFFAKQRTLFDLATHYQPTVQSFSLRFADSRLETKFGDDYDERQVKPVTQNRLIILFVAGLILAAIRYWFQSTSSEIVKSSSFNASIALHLIGLLPILCVLYYLRAPTSIESLPTTSVIPSDESKPFVQPVSSTVSHQMLLTLLMLWLSVIIIACSLIGANQLQSRTTVFTLVLCLLSMTSLLRLRFYFAFLVWTVVWLAFIVLTIVALHFVAVSSVNASAIATESIDLSISSWFSQPTVSWWDIVLNFALILFAGIITLSSLWQQEWIVRIEFLRLQDIDPAFANQSSDIRRVSTFRKSLIVKKEQSAEHNDDDNESRDNFDDEEYYDDEAQLSPLETVIRELIVIRAKIEDGAFMGDYEIDQLSNAIDALGNGAHTLNQPEDVDANLLNFLDPSRMMNDRAVSDSDLNEEDEESFSDESEHSQATDAQKSDAEKSVEQSVDRTAEKSPKQTTRQLTEMSVVRRRSTARSASQSNIPSVTDIVRPLPHLSWSSPQLLQSTKAIKYITADRRVRRSRRAMSRKNTNATSPTASKLQINTDADDEHDSIWGSDSDDMECMNRFERIAACNTEIESVKSQLYFQPAESRNKTEFPVIDTFQEPSAKISITVAVPFVQLTHSTLPALDANSLASQQALPVVLSRVQRPLSSNEAAVIERLLLNVDQNWDADLLTVYSMCARPISLVARVILSRFRLMEEFDMCPIRVDNFLRAVDLGYHRVLYHNAAHGADVCHALFILCNNAILTPRLRPIEILSMLIATICHDLQHPGYNNAFLIKTKDQKATIYNDKSVLESHHASSTFVLLSDDKNNIFSSCPPKVVLEARKLIIELILATDLALHFELLNNFKNRLAIHSATLTAAETLQAQAADDQALGAGTQRAIRSASTLRIRDNKDMSRQSSLNDTLTRQNSRMRSKRTSSVGLIENSLTFAVAMHARPRQGRRSSATLPLTYAQVASLPAQAGSAAAGNTSSRRRLSLIQTQSQQQLQELRQYHDQQQSQSGPTQSSQSAETKAPPTPVQQTRQLSLHQPPPSPMSSNRQLSLSHSPSMSNVGRPKKLASFVSSTGHSVGGIGSTHQAQSVQHSDSIRRSDSNVSVKNPLPPVSAGPTPQTLLNLFLQEPADVVLLLRMTIKCADLSHFAKTLPLHKRWNDLVLQEFWSQGDRESSLALDISPFCDRRDSLTSRVASNQCGFLDALVIPLFKTVSQVMGNNDGALDRLIENREYWAKEKETKDNEARQREEK